MNIAVVARRYKGWSCWFLKNETVELVLVPQVGGRIMGIRWPGHDLSFTQPELEGQVVDVAAVESLSAKKREMGFPLSGRRQDVAGAAARWTEGAPFLELDSGAYELADRASGARHGGVRMTNRVCARPACRSRALEHEGGERRDRRPLPHQRLGGGGRMGPLGCEHGVKDW